MVFVSNGNGFAADERTCDINKDTASKNVF